MCDCGRFSMVYLLSAVSGVAPSKLTNMDVYKGFKKWIESPSGYLSFQKNNIRPKNFTPITIDMTELGQINEEIKALDSQAHPFNVEMKTLSEKREEINKKLETEKDLDVQNTMYIELMRLNNAHHSKQGELFNQKTSKHNEWSQKISAMSADLAKSSEIQLLNGYIDMAQAMHNAPKLQPSKMAQVTGIWRKAVDVMLYAPRTTETVLVPAAAGVIYALYCLC